MALEDKQDMENTLVTQSNQLIEAKYSLSLYEQRLVLMMISMVEPNDEDFKNYIIKVEDFKNLIGLKTHNLYPKVKNLLETLATKIITIPKGGKNYLITGWISDAEYKDGVVYLSFSAKLKPYLIALKGEFTSHKLGLAIRFKGIHTVRIYTLLKQYVRLKERVFSLEEFRDKLGIEDKKYKLFGDLRKYVIAKAQKEFSEKKDGAFVSDINFNFEPIKTGRKVTGLKFHIFEQSTKPKTTPTLPPKTGTDQDKDQPQEIQEMINIGVAKKKAITLFSQYAKDEIIKALKVTAEQERENTAGFFLRALENNWDGTAEKKQKKEDKARKKEQEKRQLEKLESKKSDLEKTFRIKQKKKFLKSLSKDQTAELLKEAKKENPDLSDMIKALDSPFCGNFIVSKIPDYEKRKQDFINSELEKMGLITGEIKDKKA